MKYTLIYSSQIGSSLGNRIVSMKRIETNGNESISDYLERVEGDDSLLNSTSFIFKGWPLLEGENSIPEKTKKTDEDGGLGSCQDVMPPWA